MLINSPIPIPYRPRYPVPDVFGGVSNSTNSLEAVANPTQGGVTIPFLRHFERRARDFPVTALHACV